MWVIKQNGYKYDFSGIRRYGTAIYAPYRCKIPRNFRDWIERMFLGPRADLIGLDHMLASDERGINPRRFRYWMQSR
jgi:hypothetical protein